MNHNSRRLFSSDNWRDRFISVFLHALFPTDTFDRSSVEWNSLVKSSKKAIVNLDEDDGIPIIQMLHDLADQYDEPFPSQR